MTNPRLIASASLLLASAFAQASDFKTIVPDAAILYDAPSHRGGKLYLAPHGMPVDVVIAYGEWVKVRDATGEMAWIEAKLLSPKRNVVVKSAAAKLRATPDDNGAALMSADKGVLLELAEPQTGPWIKVHHKDGISGFVKASDIWGI